MAEIQKPRIGKIRHFAELHYFLIVTEEGSFGKAAHSLQMQVSTISRAIGKLEDRLGVTLLERTSAGIRITEAGRIASRHIRRLLQETNALKGLLRQHCEGETGDIHLGFHFSPINNLLTGLLLEWRSNYPGVTVTPYEPGDCTLHGALIDYQIDAALIPDFMLHRYETACPVYSETLMAVLPNTHRLAGHSALRWNDLRDEILLLWAWGKNGIGEDFFAARLPGANLRIFESSSMTVFAFVRAGFGITIAARGYSSLALPSLTFIPITEDNAFIEINLVWRPESEDPLLGKFVAFIRDRARARRSIAPSHAASGSPDLFP
ncbi:LysR family transcriptional regulator [Asaia siamensis]|uniref:LysR family transcriptional regulator n=1 Tax=Asaia siamensis TaxID=110479 RepID=UPI00166A1A9E|nr:LysR family transcriptional regulator [Asaia siamensis]